MTVNEANLMQEAIDICDEKKEEHESFGMIEINRFTGGDQYYFGSSIKHSGGIRLSIYNAEVQRGLNKDWYHHDNMPIVEVWMSYTQFAEAITNMNSSGTPCTIKYADGEKKESCPFTNKRLQFEEEFKEEMKTIGKKFDSLLKFAEELKSKNSIPKKDKEELLNKIKNVRQEINSSIPFIQKSFNEQMDKTVLEAKGEMEGFMEAKIRDLGISALPDALKIQIEEK